MLPKIFRGTLLALTTVVCASFPPTYAPLTEQKVTTSNSTVNPDNDVNKSSINWQPCVQPSFANWFPSYAEVSPDKRSDFQSAAHVDPTNREAQAHLRRRRLVLS